MAAVAAADCCWTAPDCPASVSQGSGLPAAGPLEKQHSRPRGWGRAGERARSTRTAVAAAAAATAAALAVVARPGEGVRPGEDARPGEGRRPPCALARAA
jgi:hypothetical protein